MTQSSGSDRDGAPALRIAIAGWLTQLAGHVVWEKRSPAFLTNLFQALIGPLFFVATLTGDFPPRASAQN